MKVWYQVELRDFQFWSGAKDRVDILQELDLWDAVEQMLQQTAGQQGLSQTDVNDYVWFQLQDDIRQGFYGDQKIQELQAYYHGGSSDEDDQDPDSDEDQDDQEI